MFAKGRRQQSDVGRASNMKMTREMAGSEELGLKNNLICKVKDRESIEIEKPSPRRRLVDKKSGKINVRTSHIPRGRYIQDVFTTLIDAKWKWVVMLFLTFYLGSWLVFGLFWYILILMYGDLCVDNVHTFAESFLFSLETSVTIGYGGRAITSKCNQGIILLIIQSLLSSLVDCAIIGLIFTKIARPGKRQTTLLFSEQAVVTKRDDKICLMFRVADVRKCQLNECHVRMYLYRTYKTIEGRTIHNHQDQLRVGCDWFNIRDDSDRLFLLFPCAVTHVIDRKSPFYNMSAERFERSDWELVVVLEGGVDATGCTLQTRTSYLASEVCWGYDFVDMEKVCQESSDQDQHQCTLKSMNRITPAPYVPRCSPREYYVHVNKDPDPNDVLGEQDELWDDENFMEPGDENRILRTHSKLTENLRNN